MVEPLAPWAVKLVKPLAAIISATLNPSALNGVVRDLAEAAFATSAPATSGSTRGTMPLSSLVAGRAGSEQMEGIETAKGLKFFSAATSFLAASMTALSLPSSETILSARVS